MGAGLSVEPDDLADATPWPRDDRTELRWAVDLSRWRPGQAERTLLLSLLPADDAAAVANVRGRPDRRRALASRLAQRRCVADALEHEFSAVVLARTKGGKPFEASGAARPAGAENFNFNVSHDGHFVVLASDPALLVGVDVNAPFELRARNEAAGGFDGVRATFDAVLTEREWEAVEGAADEAARIFAFRRAWSLKEAFVKARGDGLAFELRRVEFAFCDPPHARARRRRRPTATRCGRASSSTASCSPTGAASRACCRAATSSPSCAPPSAPRRTRGAGCAAASAAPSCRPPSCARRLAARRAFRAVAVRELLPAAHARAYDRALEFDATCPPNEWSEPADAAAAAEPKPELPAWFNPANAGSGTRLEDDPMACVVA